MIDTKSQKNIPSFTKYRLIIGSVLGFILLVALLLIVFALRDIPDLKEIERPENDLSTQIYSSDGVLLRSLYSTKNRLSVDLGKVSPNVLDALIATEDVRFYDHSGVDSKAFLGIIKDKLKGKKFRGGSTITMQLARNLYDIIGRQRSLWRKFKEMVTAIILENKYTKDEIIKTYLNTVSFVGNTYGIENGAKTYFQKPALSLNVEESAFLVGLLKGTHYYNPFKYYDRSLERRNTILDLMTLHGFLPQTTCDSLKELPINLDNFSPDDHNQGMAPYFTEHVREYMRSWCDSSGYNLYTGGLKIFTTIDSRMQQYAEEAQREHLTWLQKKFTSHIKGKEAWKDDESILDRAMSQTYRYRLCKNRGMSEEEIKENFNTPRDMTIFSYDGPIDTTLSPLDSIKYYLQFLETGVISIDPSNGHVRTWVGGIDHSFFKYDHVKKGARQVGSTFKPFVYTAAFDNGYSPCSKELNQPVFFYDKDEEVEWSPKNADGKYGGFMTLRRGLATSTNIITARLIKRIGAEEVCKTAYRMGIQSKLDCVPSIALGTTELTVSELTGAYCTFVNHGVWNEPIFITRIEDKNGNLLQEFTSTPKEAINPNTAFQMVNMLMGVVDEPGGTAGRIRFKYKLNNQIGGKTGTTQNHSDGWFMGVTPHLVTGVWVGCSDRSMRFRSLGLGQGATMALPIFGLFMQKVYGDSIIALPKSNFQRPPNFNKELSCETEENRNSDDDENEEGEKPKKKPKKSVMDFDD